MNDSLFVNFALALLTSGAIGLVVAHLNLRRDVAALELKFSEKYVNKSDLLEIKTTLNTVHTELQAVLKALYRLEADASHK